MVSTASLRSTATADEPSLGMSIGLLCAVLFAMVAIVGNVSIPDVQFVQTDFLAACNHRGHHDHAGDRYWITSSAVANSVSGMVRPSALAVLGSTTRSKSRDL
jgi:hypothetical protein